MLGVREHLRETGFGIIILKGWARFFKIFCLLHISTVRVVLLSRYPYLHVELLAQAGTEALHAVDLQAVLRLVRQAAVARGIRRTWREDGRERVKLS